MTLAEQDALDIIDKKLREAVIERMRSDWKNNWRPIFDKLKNIRHYLIMHQRR